MKCGKNRGTHKTVSGQHNMNTNNRPLYQPALDSN
jgi:hypothetical protein